jgi:molecular chaperone GrpE
MYIYITVLVRLHKLALRAGMRKLAEKPEEPKEQKEQSKSEQRAMLENALETERKRSEECLTQLRYARADIENLEKRFDRQLEDAKKHANECLMIELLGIVDELELAVKSAASCDSVETLAQGVEMTLRKFTKVLENEGVTPIKSVGEPFDPEKHSAVERTERDDVEGVTITEEVRKGYTMRGKVIRPSTVKVVVPSSQSHKITEGDELK